MKINIGKYKKNGNPRTEKIHIDPWDTWSMDYTLALIILPMLNQLKESKHGAPSSMPPFGMQSNTHQSDTNKLKSRHCLTKSSNNLI